MRTTLTHQKRDGFSQESATVGMNKPAVEVQFLKRPLEASRFRQGLIGNVAVGKSVAEHFLAAATNGMAGEAVAKMRNVGVTVQKAAEQGVQHPAAAGKSKGRMLRVASIGNDTGIGNGVVHSIGGKASANRDVNAENWIAGV